MTYAQRVTDRQLLGTPLWLLAWPIYAAASIARRRAERRQEA